MPPVVLETQHALTDFVGREIAQTEWLTITQDRIDRFAEATQDRQWIHVDRERAQRESPYGTTIAHGFLTLSLLSFFMKQVIQSKRRRPHGDQLRLESGPLSFSCSRGFTDSCPRWSSIPEGASRRAGGRIFCIVGGSGIGEALLCGGVDCPLLP